MDGNSIFRPFYFITFYFNIQIAIFYIYHIVSCYNIINFIITNNIAPGSPRIPTKIEVPIFSPIWNWNAAPTKLIIYIKAPPKIELITSFNIFFNGNIKILPTTNNIIIQAKKVMIVSVPKFNHLTFISLLWLNLDKYY